MKEKGSCEVISHKRQKTDEISEDVPQTKKARLFSIKDFRKQLNSKEKFNALKEFLSVLNHSAEHDYVFDYLKNGGNCLELLQTLESDSAIPPTVVFRLVTQLLLKINASYGQYYSSAHESCRYLINNYLPLVHKMLGLSSSMEERKACLKLLTAMAAFSPNLAKDILINVKFHSANIELLTKHTGEQNSVRDCFVHFLTAFLVDGDSHTLSILLEKSGLLTGIISGLQYDLADTVCIVVAAMKNHVLENGAVMKTTKMHVFNTSVVKDIVNLYNWKGPEGLKALDKNNRTVFEVDKIAKSKVSECVHDFLLVLCTSHKHGVIFRDHSVGLGKKNQNGLMYTVLDSLDRPWEHSYASELVIKICGSCPDLTKNLWSILKPFLEPRLADKWLNAMNFARKLIKEMEPSCIEYCSKDLGPQQLAQVIEILVSPSPILKTILSGENSTHDQPEIKLHISLLLRDMLRKIDSYLHSVKKSSGIENYAKVKQHLSNYITRNYPNAQKLFDDWKTLYLDDNLEVHEQQESSKADKYVSLETLLDILTVYKTIAPQLLYNLTSTSLNLQELLLKLTSQSEEESEKTETLQLKLTSIFVDIDHSCFLAGTELFSFIVPALLKMYRRDKTEEIRSVLNKILKKSGVFDGSSYEINIWINGIFNFDNLTDAFVREFVQIINDTCDNILEYQRELSEVSVEDGDRVHEDDFIDALLDAPEDSGDIAPIVKRRHFSPVVLALLKHLQKGDASKSMKKYSDFVLMNVFHRQTLLPKFVSLIQTYSAHLPAPIFNYIESWVSGTCKPLAKIKGSLDVFKTLSEAFLNDTLADGLIDDAQYPDFQADVLQMSTFYFGNLVDFGSVSELHAKNWTKSIDFMCERDTFRDDFLEIVLENPTLIKHFDVVQFGKATASGICTGAIIEVLEKLGKLHATGLDVYSKIYSSGVFSGLAKMLKKPKKFLENQNIDKILQICPLDYKDSVEIVTRTCALLEDKCELIDNPVLLNILTFGLNRVLFLCDRNFGLKPIDKSLILQITRHLTALHIRNKDNEGLALAVRLYLEAFPYCLSHVDAGLFSSILQLREFHADSAELAAFLLSKDAKLAEEIEAHVANVVEKKGVVLPLVQVLVDRESSQDVSKLVYERLEASILKAMQKPQKVGQHFLKNYNIGPLIGQFMPLEKCYAFAEKAQKFEVTELFHVKLLDACYTKIMNEGELTNKRACSVIMTFVHLHMALFKKRRGADDEDALKMVEVSNVFDGLLQKIVSTEAPLQNASQIATNETFKTFCKFALKYGVSGQHVLLTVLRRLVGLLKSALEKDDANLLLEMLLSHSELLNVVLGERGGNTKLEVLSLFLEICRNWNEVMEKSHVPLILSAYRGMVTRCDRTALALLKLYESKAEQTRFYDFKPFLWGRTAAAHYSVRTQIETSLIRQPKTSDVLGIIKEELVHLTIANHPLKEVLRDEGDFPVGDLRCYDLKFLLPLFSHILAPEQQVRTYVFSRSGALSLTVVGLSSQDKEVRLAACHVLSRFHFHLEARQRGKDNLLWIRFVEALCKGAAVLPDLKLNNFASIFYARAALILTNPNHVMYTPLSSYLTAKEDLDLSTVPELYTLLFSPDVNYREHRNFILEILRDGMRMDKDFVDFLKSMGFKLFSELFSSCLADADSRLLTLDVLLAACKLPLAVNVLCANYSLLPQLHTLTLKVLNEIKEQTATLSMLLRIFLKIVKIRRDLFTNRLVYDILLYVLKSESYSRLKESDLESFYEAIYTIFTSNAVVFGDKDVLVSLLLERTDDKFCNYIRHFGGEFIDSKCPSLQIRDAKYFLRLFVFKLLS